MQIESMNGTAPRSIRDLVMELVESNNEFDNRLKAIEKPTVNHHDPNQLELPLATKVCRCKEPQGFIGGHTCLTCNLAMRKA